MNNLRRRRLGCQRGARAGGLRVRRGQRGFFERSRPLLRVHCARLLEFEHGLLQKFQWPCRGVLVLTVPPVRIFDGDLRV